MEPFLDEECVFLSVGQLFYQLSVNRAVAMSGFLRLCLSSGQRSKYVQWISLGDEQKRRLLVVRLDRKSVNEMTLAKVAHYMQTDQLDDLNGSNVADILKVGKMLAVTGLTRICSEFLTRLVEQLPAKSMAEMTVMRRPTNSLEQFPTRSFLVALMLKSKVMDSVEPNQNWFWDFGGHGINAEDIIERKAPFLERSLVPWSLKDSAKRQNMFLELGTEVAPENYVYDDSEIMYLMEMTSVHKDQDAKVGDGQYGGVREEVPGSPRTLPEEWRLSPAKSVDLDEEFADMDREFLHAIYDDD